MCMKCGGAAAPAAKTNAEKLWDTLERDKNFTTYINQLDMSPFTLQAAFFLRSFHLLEGAHGMQLCM